MSQVHFYQLASWVFFANAAQSLVVFVRIRSRCFHLTLPRNMRIIGLEDTSRLRYTNPPNTKQPSASSDRKMPSLGIHIFSVQTLSCKAFRPGIKDSCRVKFADMSWERVQPTKILVCNFFVIDHFLGGRTLAQDTSATSSGFGGIYLHNPKLGTSTTQSRNPRWFQAKSSTPTSWRNDGDFGCLCALQPLEKVYQSFCTCG